MDGLTDGRMDGWCVWSVYVCRYRLRRRQARLGYAMFGDSLFCYVISAFMHNCMQVCRYCVYLYKFKYMYIYVYMFLIKYNQIPWNSNFCRDTRGQDPPPWPVVEGDQRQICSKLKTLLHLPHLLRRRALQSSLLGGFKPDTAVP